MSGKELQLINPHTGLTIFKIQDLETPGLFSKTSKVGFFTIIVASPGSGVVVSDLSEYDFSEHNLMCFSLYQPFKILRHGIVKGVVINFHPEFFCLHKHRNEVSCNGVLFNNIYESPVVNLSKRDAAIVNNINKGLKSEMLRYDTAEYEVLLSYLKILLIHGTRIRLRDRQDEQVVAGHNSEVLSQLQESIEENFRRLHKPGDYAAALHLTTSSLNRLCKQRFNKTLTGLIVERIVLEAKRELYLTNKPIKAISHALGFGDEFYFSRFFKNQVAVSPQIFRNTVGFNQANV